MKNFGVIVIVVFIFHLTGCKSDDTVVTPTVTHYSAPNAPTTPYPANGAVNISGFVTLTWDCLNPVIDDTLRYDVKIGSTNNPTDLIVSSTLNRAADLGIVDTNRTIFWKVTAKNNHGLSKDSPVWNFTTGH